MAEIRGSDQQYVYVGTVYGEPIGDKLRGIKATWNKGRQVWIAPIKYKPQIEAWIAEEAAARVQGGAALLQASGREAVGGIVEYHYDGSPPKPGSIVLIGVEQPHQLWGPRKGGRVFEVLVIGHDPAHVHRHTEYECEEMDCFCGNYGISCGVFGYELAPTASTAVAKQNAGIEDPAVLAATGELDDFVSKIRRTGVAVPVESTYGSDKINIRKGVNMYFGGSYLVYGIGTITLVDVDKEGEMVHQVEATLEQQEHLRSLVRIDRESIAAQEEQIEIILAEPVEPYCGD